MTKFTKIILKKLTMEESNKFLIYQKKKKLNCSMKKSLKFFLHKTNLKKFRFMEEIKKEKVSWSVFQNF